jgi:peptide/nickel transport system substrate-binding protein
LYLYGSPNPAARSVLSAIYDGPIDQVNYGYQPVLFDQLPSIENGGAQIARTSVKVGDEIVNADGQVATLDSGVRVRPAGCRDDTCAIEYDGQSALEMDQMVATFILRTDLAWSDGTPLTSADSVYSFQLASDPDTAGSRYLIDRTQAYEAADDQTVQWWGKPGYIDSTYFLNFWSPLPQHLWGQYDTKDLAQMDIVARTPLGWGPYIIDEWIPGEQIHLSKNYGYFRAGENLPKFDTLTFRFISDPNAAITALVDGSCDLLDPSIPLDGQTGLLLQMQDAGQIKAVFGMTTTMERLDFGVKPAVYDNIYNYAAQADHPNLLADKRTRQAIAMCLDRKKVVDTVLYGLSVIPNTYVPPDHLLYNSQATAYPFDIGAGNTLLDQIGWKDLDNDPSTPRQAQNIDGIQTGTPLVLEYLTTTAVQRRQVSEILTQSLAQCGVGLQPKYVSAPELYAEGPSGQLFGRNFYLAEYAMGSTGQEPTCEWFSTSQIPTEDNHWLGVNVSGYSNPDYDAACQQARQSLSNEPSYQQGYQTTQAIFAEDLPSVPLYMRLKVAAARSDFCNFSLDPTTTSELWSLETLDYGDNCGT